MIKIIKEIMKEICKGTGLGLKNSIFLGFTFFYIACVLSLIVIMLVELYNLFCRIMG